MPRFVVLEHDHPLLHWDLMLEKEASLRTWRLSSPPSQPGPIDAEPLADHRIAYLDYEGPVSGNRGNVTRWDHGTYEPLTDTDNRIELQLTGKKLSGP